MVKHALIFAGVDDLKLEKYSVDPEPGDGGRIGNWYDYYSTFNKSIF